MKDFGILLKTLRKKSALTQKELADKLGIDSTNISKWEREKSLPDVSVFPQIAKILNVSCEDLLHPTETLKKISQLSDDNAPLVREDMTTFFNNTNETDLSAEAVVITKRRKLFTPKRTLLACMLILVLAISTCVYFCNQGNFTFVEARTNVESQYGLAYELVFYHKTKYPTHVFEEHAGSLQEAWENGKYSESNENILIVSYYLSKDSVDSWDEAYHRSFYLRNLSQ